MNYSGCPWYQLRAPVQGGQWTNEHRMNTAFTKCAPMTLHVTNTWLLPTWSTWHAVSHKKALHNLSQVDLGAFPYSMYSIDPVISSENKHAPVIYSLHKKWLHFVTVLYKATYFILKSFTNGHVDSAIKTTHTLTILSLAKKLQTQIIFFIWGVSPSFST